MSTKILDAHAVMSFLKDEPGADIVRNLILKAVEGNVTLEMCIVNLGEVWYAIARATSPEKADQYVQEIRGMAIEIADADWQLTRQAAVFKVSGNISYADCFAAALAKNHKAELITGDKEFKALEDEIKIVWI
jgi:predicted nucleic acid-binding protein